MLALPLLTCGGVDAAHAAGKWEVIMVAGTGLATASPQSNFNWNDNGYGFPTAGFPWSSYIYVPEHLEGDAGSGSSWYSVESTKAGATVEHKDIGSAASAVFKWNDDDGHGGHDPLAVLPTYLFVKVTGHAFAYAESYAGSDSGYANPESSVTVEANDGYRSATPAKTHNTGGENQQAEASITTTRILKIPTNGSWEIPVTLPVGSTKAVAIVPSPSSGWGYYGHAGSYLSVHVQEDDRHRGILMSRAGARGPIKIQGAPDVAIDELRDEWLDNDGNAHGQSRWSYTSRDAVTGENNDYTDTPVAYSAVIGAQPVGSWSPLVVGAWSPSDSRDRQPPQNSDASHIQDIPDGGSFLNNSGWNLGLRVEEGWYNVPSSGPVNPIIVAYTLNDNFDKAEARGTYSLQLHDEWEHPSDNPDVSWTDETGTSHPGESRRGPISYSLPISPSTYSGVNGAPQSTEWKVTWTAGAEATLAGTFGASFKLKDWLNLGGTFESKASLSVSAQVASTAYASLIPGDTAFPIINYFVNTKHRLVDHYEVAGCDFNSARSDGKWDKSADLPLRPQDIRPGWIINHSGGNNPTP